MSRSADTQPQSAETILRVTEIYKSVQGESTWAGLPCIFVRLSGCPLRCVWCDTEYAFYGGEKLSVAAIVDQCRALGGDLIEITGGEPLAQPECPDLAQAFLDAGFTVLIETSGSLPISSLPAETIKIMDLKCPDSGEGDKNDWTNIDALTDRDEVKFVIASRRDYEWSREQVTKHNLSNRCKAALFSPVFGAIEGDSLVKWILEDKLNVRFQLQLHKYVWPPDAKGV